MAEVKIKPGSLTIEVLDDQGKLVDTHHYSSLTLTKVRLEPKNENDPKYGKARDIWGVPQSLPEPARR